MDPELKKQVESIVFSCGRKIEPEEIAGLVNVAPSLVKKAAAELAAEYDQKDCALAIIQDGTAWKMTVREKYVGVVRKITPYMEFSKTIMETLAVVAWKQPILQSDVIRIRTNKAYDHILELEKLGFLSKEKHGRSFLLKLSQKFYDYFDLRNDVDVRNLFKHIKDDSPEVQTKIGDATPAVEDKLAPELQKKKELTLEDGLGQQEAK
jgi:segregation and condensation protein B